MITFLSAIAFLIAGYFFYGRFIDRFFGIDPNAITPAIRLEDGVDFIPMKPWRMYLIQFLNIAGLGPIFGAILGAMYGPMAYIWIVLGNIFMGSVHDYFSGMLSIRENGASLPELVGKYLGNGFRQVLRIFTLLLLIMVGVAFVTGPAGLLAGNTGISFYFWLYLIFGYYILATLLPINQIIGRIYPFFGFALISMAIAVAGYMIINGLNGNFHMTELSLNSFKNLHNNPVQNILFPMMFIVISCGAISGFHATQSPMMARCMTNEKQGRSIFYGAMVTEGIVAIIWATVAMNYFGSTEGLNGAIAAGKDPATIVNEISTTWFGKAGALLAIIGVVAAPITTGDTAFRSARLTLSDMFNIKQGKITQRLWLSIPIFVIGFFLSQINFSVIWKYLGLFNQLLSVIMLWTAASFLAMQKKNHWIMSIPAVFMTLICFTYLLIAPVKNGGLALSPIWAYSIGSILTFGAFLWFVYSRVRFAKKINMVSQK